jgi:hypothetical protein
MQTERARKITGQILIGLVLFFNLQSAVEFLLHPWRYLASFELAGTSGETMIRSLAILFLMWNVPYVVALWNPVRNRTSLIEALVMQLIGLVGESVLLYQLPEGHANLVNTGLRFIAFDAFGLLCLLTALLLTGRGLFRRRGVTPAGSG